MSFAGTHKWDLTTGIYGLHFLFPAGPRCDNTWMRISSIATRPLGSGAAALALAAACALRACCSSGTRRSAYAMHLCSSCGALTMEWWMSMNSSAAKKRGHPLIDPFDCASVALLNSRTPARKPAVAEG